MTDEATPRNNNNGGVSWPGILLMVVLIAYPLSMGPFWWLREHGYLTPGEPIERWLVGFYGPVEEVATLMPPFKAALKWYVGWFAPI